MLTLLTCWNIQRLGNVLEISSFINSKLASLSAVENPASSHSTSAPTVLRDRHFSLARARQISYSSWVMFNSLPIAKLQTLPLTLGGMPCHHNSRTLREQHIVSQLGKISLFQVKTALPMLSSSLQRSSSCFFLFWASLSSLFFA